MQQRLQWNITFATFDNCTSFQTMLVAGINFVKSSVGAGRQAPFAQASSRLNDCTYVFWSLSLPYWYEFVIPSGVIFGTKAICLSQEELFGGTFASEAVLVLDGGSGMLRGVPKPDFSRLV